MAKIKRTESVATCPLVSLKTKPCQFSSVQLLCTRLEIGRTVKQWHFAVYSRKLRTDVDERLRRGGLESSPQINKSEFGKDPLENPDPQFLYSDLDHP